MTDDTKKEAKHPKHKTDDLQAKIEEAKKADEKVHEQEHEQAKAQDETEKQMNALKEALARCMADMQNYKRRAEEDKMRFVKFANSELLKELIPIIDNFDRSCQHLPDSLKEDAWAKGVMHTHDDLMKALEKIGVKRIETVGKKLDPTKHEAVLQGPGEKDVVVEELEPGYMYHEETLKPAKVKVGDGTLI